MPLDNIWQIISDKFLPGIPLNGTLYYDFFVCVNGFISVGTDLCSANPYGTLGDPLIDGMSDKFWGKFPLPFSNQFPFSRLSLTFSQISIFTTFPNFFTNFHIPFPKIPLSFCALPNIQAIISRQRRKMFQRCRKFLSDNPNINASKNKRNCLLNLYSQKINEIKTIIK